MLNIWNRDKLSCLAYWGTLKSLESGNVGLYVLSLRKLDLYGVPVGSSKLCFIFRPSWNFFTMESHQGIHFFRMDPLQAWIQKFFKRGWGGKFWKKNVCWYTYLLTREHIKTRQTCNSFSLLPFQKDCLLFFALFYYSLLFLKFERWGLQPP